MVSSPVLALFTLPAGNSSSYPGSDLEFLIGNSHRPILYSNFDPIAAPGQFLECACGNGPLYIQQISLSFSFRSAAIEPRSRLSTFSAWNAVYNLNCICQMGKKKTSRRDEITAELKQRERKGEDLLFEYLRVRTFLSFFGGGGRLHTCIWDPHLTACMG